MQPPGYRNSFSDILATFQHLMITQFNCELVDGLWFYFLVLTPKNKIQTSKQLCITYFVNHINKKRFSTGISTSFGCISRSKGLSFCFTDEDRSLAE